jgi:hypothetical protein
LSILQATPNIEKQMPAENPRGTLEHCLAQGRWASRLLNRFRSVVSEKEMALVQYWFEELHTKAALYLQLGHELVSVGIESREDCPAVPFMVFNPTRWNGPRRELLAPTAGCNPRNWVTIQVRHTQPSRAVAANSH